MPSKKLTLLTYFPWVNMKTRDMHRTGKFEAACAHCSVLMTFTVTHRHSHRFRCWRFPVVSGLERFRSTQVAVKATHCCVRQGQHKNSECTYTWGSTEAPCMIVHSSSFSYLRTHSRLHSVRCWPLSWLLGLKREALDMSIQRYEAHGVSAR